MAGSWSIAELLRGDVKPADYGSFILPFTVLRRIDCVLEKSKPAVVAAAKGIKNLDNLRLDERKALEKAAGFKLYNASALTLATILDDPAQVRANLEAYIGGFIPNVRDIFERYKFEARVIELDEKDLLYKVLKEFVAVDPILYPRLVVQYLTGKKNVTRKLIGLDAVDAGGSASFWISNEKTRDGMAVSILPVVYYTTVARHEALFSLQPMKIGTFNLPPRKILDLRSTLRDARLK